MYLAGWKEILPVDKACTSPASGRQGTCTSLTGRKSFQPARYMYLVDWKEILPAGEVHVPRRLERNPSRRRGTCTSSAGRNPFRSTRYMYLVNWKEILPAGEVHVPHRLEGNPSSRSLAGRLKGGYPRIPAQIPAAADGYPPAGSDADADGYFAAKSSRISGCELTISTGHAPDQKAMHWSGEPNAAPEKGCITLALLADINSDYNTMIQPDTNT
ncbi:hypothetical protein PGTUg99_023030 [Puccinia graminis f. sp. tritici]|uniref:Uncharacterized protein n=1 Tax=Puccinia graminis f. sp. tritici TaxID=56615 RepID=A0A5B0R807_PUCGR|nr:hypothetical protein PGTUg99_023030 [Puccinia graminis f. sp. tritici]